MKVKFADGNGCNLGETDFTDRIAVVERGGCSFVKKALEAQVNGQFICSHDQSQWLIANFGRRE